MRRSDTVTITTRRSDVVVRTGKISPVVKIKTRSIAVRTSARSAVVKTRARSTVARNEMARITVTPRIATDKTSGKIICETATSADSLSWTIRLDLVMSSYIVIIYFLKHRLNSLVVARAKLYTHWRGFKRVLGYEYFKSYYYIYI